MYDKSPKVSVICLCHNQAAYVQESIRSVIAQTYRPIELIITDDGSKDDSVDKIKEILPEIPPDIRVETIFFTENKGNCKVFNHALRLATGTYVIDHAADDVLLPERVAGQVAAFENAPSRVGVVFSDAWIIDTQGRKLRTFYRRNAAGELTERVPSGDIYTELLHRHCVCTAAVMMRREVLEELGGYDENLVYEDYDFWVRSSRRWLYLFHDQISTLRRIVPSSHSSNMYRWGFSAHRHSTLQVCRKAAQLNQTPSEDAALARMIRYQMRLCLRYGDLRNLKGFYELLQKISPKSIPKHLLELAIS